MENCYQPAFSINPNKVVLYDRWMGGKSSKSRNNKNNASDSNSTKGYENLKDNTNITGELSTNAARRLLKALDYMIYLSREKTNYGHFVEPTGKTENNTIKEKNAENGLILDQATGKPYSKPINYKLTFVTLTLSSPQVHSDNEIKAKLLNQFLIELRKNHGVQMYIWKAEKQQNKNIHFHILTDRFIHWRTLRNLWNRIQNKLGYIDRYQLAMQNFYREGFQKTTNANDHRSISQQLKAWKRGKECNWTDPNSTDIHAIYKAKDIRQYMAKYLAKGTDKNDEARAEKMRFTLKQINELTESLASDELLPRRQLDVESYAYKQSLLLELQSQFDEMRAMGVDGRIWGSSQILSKLKGLGDLGDPPNMDLIDEFADSKYINKLSADRNVVTYIIDFNKTPMLKAYFDEYIDRHLVYTNNKQKEAQKKLDFTSDVNLHTVQIIDNEPKIEVYYPTYTQSTFNFLS